MVCFVLVEEAVLSLQLIMQLFPTSGLWGFCIQPLLPAHCLVSVPKCSKSCDSGIRTRQVICADGDSKFYSPETCKAIQPQKPATLGSCNTQPCYLPQREWYCCTSSSPNMLLLRSRNSQPCSILCSQLFACLSPSCEFAMVMSTKRLQSPSTCAV